jgi:thiol:disulfide interchange protein DsbC
MKKISLVLIIAGCLLISWHENVLAFAQGDQDCLKCHTLNNDQAKKTLAEMIPDVKILDVQQSAVKGLWEIGIESGGRKGIVYLDYSGKHLLAGNLYSIQAKRNLTQEHLQEINKVDVSQIPLNDALVMGEKNAKHKVIVFDDPD